MHSFPSLLLMFAALAIASALPQDWSGPEPEPVGVCGLANFFHTNIKLALRDDSVCNQVTRDIKSIKVNKGCICGAWNADSCGGIDPMNGIKLLEAAPDGNKMRELKQEDHVRWYKCARL